MEINQSNLQKTSKRIVIELLALDLDTCSRCVGTSENIRGALVSVAGVLRETGVEVEFRETVVRTAEQAEQLRFQSSPTVRINGIDIGLGSPETKCEDCGKLCGCNGSVNCRVWLWRGEKFPAAPKGLIIDAVLNAYVRWDDSLQPAGTPFRLPENLQAFFAARKSQSTSEVNCCDESACCETAYISACCGSDVRPQSCGCQFTDAR